MDLRRRALLYWLPAALSAGYALFSFWPQREGLPGFGDDPAFNAWHFLHLFRTLDAHGPLAVFGRAIWDAPIFAPGGLRLALSENQLWAGLALWPVWKATGQLVPTLTAGLVLLHLAAFASAAAWLRGRGARELCCWGGLLYSASGFLQCHYAHWQNACVFLLPLALWSFDRLRARPGLLRAALCGLAFGWVSGWNVYYFLGGALLCAGLFAHALVTRALPIRLAAAAALAALLVNLPILPRYAEVASEVGSFGAWEYYPAALASVLARPGRPSLLEATLTWWPRAHGLGIEATGFVGLAWLALAALAATRPRQRWPLAAGLVAYWASMGPGYGLYDLLALSPGFSGLRAVGRLQLFFTLATLLAVVSLLEEQRGRWRWVPLCLVLVELIPAGPALRAHVPAAIDGPPTPLEAALAGDASPVLVLSEVSPLLQLAVLRSGAALLQGYSGRMPAGADLLYDRAVRQRLPLGDLLDLTRARRVLTESPWRLAEARGSGRLRDPGCFDALGAQVCLFEARAPQEAAAPGVRLREDTEARVTPLPDGAVLELIATRAGLLDYAALSECHVERLLQLPLGVTRRHDEGLEGRGFRALRFEAGQVVYRKDVRGPWRTWPAWVRPQVSARLACSGRGASAVAVE